jgi:methionyl-tRNA formyltransferase
MSEVNILLLTMDEPMYMPRYLEPVIHEHTVDISKVVIAPHPGETLSKTVRQRLKMFGPTAFLKYGAHFGVGTLLGKLPHRLQRTLTGKYHSVSAVCDAYDVPVQVEKDINRDGFLTEARSLDLDLILSISCGQKLGSKLLSIPTEDAINLHGSLLPKYRGRATAFWVLYHDEEYSGVTAHYMNEEFDDGDIVCQRRFPIADDDTMHDVYNKVVKTGVDVAADIIEQVREGTVDPRPQPTGDVEYRSLPDPADRREFLRRENKFR